MNEEQENNSQNSFFDGHERKGREKAERDSKNKQKKSKFIQIMLKNPKVRLAIILIAIALIMILVVILPAFVYIINRWDVWNINEAKSSTVTISYADKSTVAEDSKIVIKPSNNNDSYEISNTYTDEEINNIKNEIEAETSKDVSEFSDFELTVIKGFLDNGLDVDSFTTEELKCLPQFLKAESCTKFLDLRPNNEKMDGSNYKPKQMNELGENEVPGIILVQRTNTRETTPVTLEYKKLEEFNTLVSNNDINVKNYFTINEKGNLVVAKWDSIKIEVNGDYPENLAEEEKTQGKDIDYMILTTEIPYSQYVEKYTMPFDFLTQLLVITEDPEFCLEVADIVLGSKIIINIQEEETITTTVEEKTYDVHNKEEKYIDYEVEPNIENKTNHLLNLDKDDEGNNCTIYEKEEKKVTIKTTNTSHTYKFEILEADTWIAHYKKTYIPQTKKTDPTKTETIDSQGEYEAGQEKVITDSAEILNDKQAKQFKEDKEKYYKKLITIPKVELKSGTKQIWDSLAQVWVEIPGDYEIKITPENKIKSTSLEDSKTTDKYSTVEELPSQIKVTTKKTDACPFEVSFTYQLNANRTKYSDPIISNALKCNITKLVIKPYSKINLNNYVTITVESYPSDPNPTTNSHIYAKNDSGNFEKFLLAYDNNKKAVELMRDVDSWLFEMMEENENTIDLVDTIKYLLYIYDGTDYGVTELDLSMFNPIEFTTINGNGTGYWWPVGSDTTEDINGVTYATGEPSSVNITSKYGPRSISASGFHYGIDISGHRNANIIAVKAGVVQKVVDQYGEGGFDQSLANRANYIIIKHDDGTSSAYWHLEKGTTKVSEGDRVEQGQVIAGMGNSGYSSGVHLHFEIRDANGNRLNPEEFVNKDNPRPTLAAGGLSEELYSMLIYFEGGTQYITATGDYTIFNNGIDKNYELTCGIAVGYQGYGSYYPDLVPNPTIGQVVSKDIYNQIFERVCNEKNNYIDIACAKHDVTLTQNQRDAVFLFVYNMSDGKNAADKAIKAYKDGGNEAYYQYTKSASIQAVQSRRAKEYELFKNGTYIK